jgi:hypothetical protein
MSDNDNHAIESNRQGKITHMGLLDLRHLRSIDELANVTRISHIGTILVSDQLQGSINRIPMNHVGSILTLPADMKVKLLTGDLKLSGDFLENANGDPDETLLIVGTLMITSPLRKIGYKSLILTGELVAPKGSEPILTSAISQLIGELYFYADEPRLFTGQDRFGSDFFQYLKQPVTLFLRGEFSIEPDVTPELLQAKVSEVFLWGNIRTANSKQAALLLALAAVKYGDILVEQH